MADRWEPEYGTPRQTAGCHPDAKADPRRAQQPGGEPGRTAAMVAFYGTPLPSAEEIARIKSPVLAKLGFHIYQGTNHAFRNDTGPYDATASCDAWSRTLAYFNKFLRTPAPG